MPSATKPRWTASGWYAAGSDPPRWRSSTLQCKGPEPLIGRPGRVGDRLQVLVERHRPISALGRGEARRLLHRIIPGRCPDAVTVAAARRPGEHPLGEGDAAGRAE